MFAIFALIDNTIYLPLLTSDFFAFFREKSEIHRMVIQGGSFKGRSGDLKPKEVVSLLLDDEEIEKRVREKAAEAEKERRTDASTDSLSSASVGSSSSGKRKLPRCNSDVSPNGGKRKAPRNTVDTTTSVGKQLAAGGVTENELCGGRNMKPVVSPPAKIVRQRSGRSPWPPVQRRRTGGSVQVAGVPVAPEPVDGLAEA